MGVPGGKLNQRHVGEIMATIYQHWVSKQVHVLLLGSNDLRKSGKNLVFLQQIEFLCLFFKQCREKGAKVQFIVCTPVPAPATPNHDELHEKDSAATP